MKTLGYILFFTAIQVVALALAIVGLPICAALSYGGYYKQDSGEIRYRLFHFPEWAWIFDNAEDGVIPIWYIMFHSKRNLKFNIFLWTAIRNPCNNFRFVRGVSKVGRPLWRVTWRMFGKPYYAQAGWQPPTGRPVLSAGADIYVLYG